MKGSSAILINLALHHNSHFRCRKPYDICISFALSSNEHETIQVFDKQRFKL